MPAPEIVKVRRWISTLYSCTAGSTDFISDKVQDYTNSGGRRATSPRPVCGSASLQGTATRCRSIVSRLHRTREPRQAAAQSAWNASPCAFKSPTILPVALQESRNSRSCPKDSTPRKIRFGLGTNAPTLRIRKQRRQRAERRLPATVQAKPSDVIAGRQTCSRQKFRPHADNKSSFARRGVRGASTGVPSEGNKGCYGKHASATTPRPRRKRVRITCQTPFIAPCPSMTALPETTTAAKRYPPAARSAAPGPTGGDHPWMVEHLAGARPVMRGLTSVSARPRRRPWPRPSRHCRRTGSLSSRTARGI